MYAGRIKEDGIDLILQGDEGVGDFAHDGFLVNIELDFHFHVGDIDVSVSFVGAGIGVIGMDFWELRVGDMGCEQQCERADNERGK